MMTDADTTPMMMMASMNINRTYSSDSVGSFTSSKKRGSQSGDVVHCHPFGDGIVVAVQQQQQLMYQSSQYDDPSATGSTAADSDATATAVDETTETTSSSSSSSIITSYKIRLAFGTLYASEQGIIKMNEMHHKEWKKRQQQQTQQQKSLSSKGKTKIRSKPSSTAAAGADNSHSSSRTTAGCATDANGEGEGSDPGATMALNVAYEALETMRKLNLELTCQELGVPFDATKCTRCLLSQQPQQNSQQRASTSTTTILQPKKGTPCFICASPTCKVHSCATFRKEGNNTVCYDCKHLYSLDYVLAIMTMATRAVENDVAQQTCTQLLTRMLDTYDRTILVLKYSSQFMPNIIQALESNKNLKNKVGIGSSSVGLMSGSLGIAATACLLTPVSAVFAPPLIIASILCGGTSSVLQTGVEMGTSNSESNQLATRIIALYGMCKSILRTVAVLQDLVDMIHHDKAQKLANGKVMQLNGDAADCFATNHEKARMVMTTAIKSGQEAENTKALTTTTSSFATATTTEVGSAAGKNARFITRSGASTVSMSSNAVSASGNALSASMMTAAQFATFAGGALSAAVLVCEAHTMTQTIIDIRNGSKCPRADLLRQILLDLNILPPTMELDRQVHDATTTLTNLFPGHKMSMEEAKQLLIDLLGPEQVPNYVDDLKKLQQEQQKNNQTKEKWPRARRFINSRSRSNTEKNRDGAAVVDKSLSSSRQSEETNNDDDDEMRCFCTLEETVDDEGASNEQQLQQQQQQQPRRGFWRSWTT